MKRSEIIKLFINANNNLNEAVEKGYFLDKIDLVQIMEDFYIFMTLPTLIFNTKNFNDNDLEKYISFVASMLLIIYGENKNVAYQLMNSDLKNCRNLIDIAKRRKYNDFDKFLNVLDIYVDLTYSDIFEKKDIDIYFKIIKKISDDFKDKNSKTKILKGDEIAAITSIISANCVLYFNDETIMNFNNCFDDFYKAVCFVGAYLISNINNYLLSYDSIKMFVLNYHHCFSKKIFFPTITDEMADDEHYLNNLQKQLKEYIDIYYKFKKKSIYDNHLSYTKYFLKDICADDNDNNLIVECAMVLDRGITNLRKFEIETNQTIFDNKY